MEALEKDTPETGVTTAMDIDQNAETSPEERKEKELKAEKKSRRKSRPITHEEPISDERYHSLPELKVLPLIDTTVVKDLICPDDASESSFDNICSAQASSTYPWIPGRPQREGDPICDYYRVKFFQNRTLLALADGCNWGMRSKEAAKSAAHAFSDYVEEQQSNIKDVKDAGHFLLRAFDKASRQIVEGKENIWDAGTTTLIGGLVLRLEDERWCFVCVSVGDCKVVIIYTKQQVFRWIQKSKHLIDVTKGNRNNLTDPRDPGGRLGPQLTNGEPDLRNLRMYYTELQEGDILIFVSDGIHDNMDPQFLGKSPMDFNINYPTWEEAEKGAPTATEEAKNEFRMNIMQKKLCSISKHKKTRPKQIVRWLLEYCQETTEASRVWMQDNPTKHLPFDYEKFPGKLDHATCIALRVGSYDEKKSPPGSGDVPRKKERKEHKEHREHREHKEHKDNEILAKEHKEHKEHKDKEHREKDRSKRRPKREKKLDEESPQSSPSSPSSPDVAADIEKTD